VGSALRSSQAAILTYHFAICVGDCAGGWQMDFLRLILSPKRFEP
jgi:hypothetical protein